MERKGGEGRGGWRGRKWRRNVKLMLITHPMHAINTSLPRDLSVCTQSVVTVLQVVLMQTNEIEKDVCNLSVPY